MNRVRRLALWAFILALIVILAIGFYRAATHQEARPDTTPAGAASTAPR